jgi:hypothetical protein
MSELPAQDNFSGGGFMLDFGSGNFDDGTEMELQQLEKESMAKSRSRTQPSYSYGSNESATPNKSKSPSQDSLATASSSTGAKSKQNRASRDEGTKVYIPPHKRGRIGVTLDENVSREVTREVSSARDVSLAHRTVSFSRTQRSSSNLKILSKPSAAIVTSAASMNWRNRPLKLDEHRPGRIAWLPLYQDIGSKSILHDHVDFGTDPYGNPLRAYGHPTLIYKWNEDDEERVICLKITSWSDRKDEPKWRDTNGAQARRCLYVPLAGTNRDLQQVANEMAMPVLEFEGDKNMPAKEDDEPNRSYVNIERVFLVEKKYLEPFKINRQTHELYLTEGSLERLKIYRLGKGTEGCDKDILETQRRDSERIGRIGLDPVSSISWRPNVSSSGQLRLCSPRVGAAHGDFLGRPQSALL